MQGNGGLSVFMGTPKLIGAMNLGLCFQDSVVVVTYLGYVWGIIMNSCSQVKRRVVILDLRSDETILGCDK